MKKLILFICSIVAVFNLLMMSSLVLAQNTPAQKNLMARVLIPDELHPDFAPAVKVAEKNEKGEPIEKQAGYEAAYANLVLQLVAGGLLYLAGPLAIGIIAISGLRYVTSHGNQNMMEGAKKTLMYGIIGLLIVIFSYAIVKAIVSLVVGI